MMKSTPVRCSRERMFRPSRPMIRPFMSSDGSSTTDTVVSAAWLAATRWSASATRLRARRLASIRASSSSWRTLRASSCRTRSSARSRRCCFASFTVMPETRSSSASCCSRACLWSSCSCLRWVSRSVRPCSRRTSSVSFRSMSSSLESTRSSTLTIRERCSETSASISARSRTASSRAPISPSRRNASASRFASSRICLRSRRAWPSRDFSVTPAAITAKVPPTINPMRIPIATSTLALLGRLSAELPRHHPARTGERDPES